MRLKGRSPMAKKPDNDTGPDEDGEASPAEDAAAAVGSRRKLIMFGGAGALALTLVAGGGAFFLMGGPKQPASETAPAAKKPVSFLEMREMTVNLQPDSAQDRGRFLRFRVALEVKDSRAIADIQPLLPRVEDTFQVFVREMRASDLEGSGGLYRLREELLRRVNVAVHPAKVDAVLFKEVVVQ
jgi:flagellar FliL protein